MKGADHALASKRVAEYLVGEGGSPGAVSLITGLPGRFVNRLARERRARPLMRGSVTGRIWASDTGAMQATIFGLCLRRERRTAAERTEMEVFFAAYRLFSVLRKGIFGAGQFRFTPDEALEVVRVEDASRVVEYRCRHCDGVFWLERDRVRRLCPICNQPHGSPAVTKVA